MPELLNEDQLSYIRSDLTGRGIESKELLNELVDHIACEVELKMELGNDFQDSYENAIATNGIDSLSVLQEEFVRTLSARFNIMKRLYLLPLACTVIALLAKLFHLPLVTFFAALTILLLVLLQLKIAIDFFENKDFQNSNSLFAFFTLLSAGLIAFGCLLIFGTSDLHPGSVYLGYGTSVFACLCFACFLRNHLTIKPQSLQLIISGIYLLVAARFLVIQYALYREMILPEWLINNHIFTPAFVLLQLLVFTPVLLFKGLYRNQLLTTLILSGTIITIYYLPF